MDQFLWPGFNVGANHFTFTGESTHIVYDTQSVFPLLATAEMVEIPAAVVEEKE